MTTGFPTLGAMGDVNKWNLPNGWKPEQKYDKNVLIGNWYEDRLKFERTAQAHNSTQRRDFRCYPNARPDKDVRRNAFLLNKGLPKDLFFGHHGKAYSNNMVTLYDEHFNKRERPEGQKLPPTRNWNSKTMTWHPERSDYPLQAEPTNWGLKDQVAQRQMRQMEDQNVTDFTTTYSLGYVPKPIDTSMTRFATPRERSSVILPINKLNQNLKLRSVTMVNPQMPQELQVPRPYVL